MKRALVLALLAGCAPGTASVGTLPLPAGKVWAQNPNLPPGGQFVFLAGAPTAAGLYTFRVKLPAGLKVMPHTHPDDRMYTVLEGQFTIGLGTEFDATKLTVLGPGDVYFLPAGTPHFHWAEAGTTVAEVTGIGPTATVYVHPEDDPRRH